MAKCFYGLLISLRCVILKLFHRCHACYLLQPGVTKQRVIGFPGGFPLFDLVHFHQFSKMI